MSKVQLHGYYSTMDHVYGYVERITFQNTENGFTVARIKEPRKRDLTTVVGPMPNLRPGETVKIHGEWIQDLVHGRQFKVKRCEICAPADIEGIKKYLGSGLIKGIGPVYAKRIVAQFGEVTLDVIDKQPERLCEVPGLGKKRIEKIAACWEEQKGIREVMIFLQQWGISPAYAQKIFKKYGAESIDKVSGNPYCLSRDIRGIGFRTADTIAKKMGIAHDSPERLDAGIEHVLSSLSDDGHVCYPAQDLLVVAGEILEVEPAQISERMEILYLEGRIALADILEQGEEVRYAWFKPLFIGEQGIAKHIHRLQSSDHRLRQIDIDKAVDWVEKLLNIELAKNQQTAIKQSLTEKVQIITGGPGTGKSTITNGILAITSKLTEHITLAAPTGRAAKRMREITGRAAVTIHSLLEYSFSAGGFKKNQDNPLECDLLIVDEASMIDTLLMYHLLKAIPDHAKVIFVGDIHQLPSVGPGNVLKDLIQSKRIPVTTLDHIFRQAAGSKIITNAHRINQGTFPDIRSESDSDFFFLEAKEPEKIMDSILGLVSKRLPKRYGFHPIQDIQILAPMKKGRIGIESLNHVLQQALNPSDHFLERSGRRFQIGDKVMQLRNNYNKNVFNGDIGKVHDFDREEELMIVEYDGEHIEYSFSELEEIVLAYAVSIHKYQGSECPCVIIPVHESHFKLLTRNLIYTGVTRGKKLVMLVGSKRAVAMAVRNDEVRHRHTGLRQAVVGMDHYLPI